VAAVEFLLNGAMVRVEDPERHVTLLDFIRASGLTGAKEGCAEGECGACAVAMVTPAPIIAHSNGSAYTVVNSCLVLLPTAAGREIYTVEALTESGELSQAQVVMAAAGASQCGYCTPGFVMSLFAEHHRPGRAGPCETSALAGNLCRCTGYRPIGDAVRSLGPGPVGPLAERLRRPAPRLAAAATGTFSRPTSVDECVEILRARPDATLVAGGTDVGVESNLHGRRWPHLVSLEAIDELRAFSNVADRISIGAGLPLAEIGWRWQDAPAAVVDWLRLFASPLIRNRATLGGNLATASPIGDAAPLLLALDASVTLAGPGGRRVLPLTSFFTGYRRTALAPGELLVSIDIPKPLPQAIRFYKVAKRRIDDISTVAAAIAVDLDSAGRVRHARFAFGGVAATPVRLTAAEEALLSRRWDDEGIALVQAIIDDSLHPLTDHRGSREYRLEVTKSLIEKYRWELAS
jgi:xanthine dehydrogenase small subunit